MVVRREMSFMKKNVAYRTKKKWGVRNKMRCKKKMDNNWALRKTNWGKVKKIGYLGYKEKNAV